MSPTDKPHPCPICGDDLCGMKWEEGFMHNEQHVKELMNQVMALEIRIDKIQKTQES